MKEKFLSAFLMSTISMFSYANSTCYDFSGHYQFEGECTPSEELILPQGSSFSPYPGVQAPMTSKGTFEIKQEGCEKVTFISHAVITYIPDSMKKDFPDGILTENYEFINFYDGDWLHGTKKIVSIDNDELKLEYHSWKDWSVNPLVFFLRSTMKSKWRIKKTDVLKNYNLEIKATHKTWADILPERRNVRCLLKKGI